ncbi:hypothetical protein [Candidatus Poriferisodalis sp.]|uniref:hypothetical protein n=1 Tax=Candidatus Poriferisodalis sp. TaxID=3101277 RepID=UPI003B027967
MPLAQWLAFAAVVTGAAVVVVLVTAGRVVVGLGLAVVGAVVVVVARLGLAVVVGLGLAVVGAVVVVVARLGLAVVVGAAVVVVEWLGSNDRYDRRSVRGLWVWGTRWSQHWLPAKGSNMQRRSVLVWAADAGGSTNTSSGNISTAAAIAATSFLGTGTVALTAVPSAGRNTFLFRPAETRRAERAARDRRA